MNPGGDYGKRELSPALRNRFTEIWVPNTQCIEDIRMIIKDRMEMKGIQQSAVETLLPFIDTLIEFMDFYNGLFDNTSKNIVTFVTLRDILAIVDNMRICVNDLHMESSFAFYESVSMILLEGIGLGMGMDRNTANRIKDTCYQYIKTKMNIKDEDLSSFLSIPIELNSQSSKFGCSPYYIDVLKSENEATKKSDFLYNPKTTSMNIRRVLRALQVHKPILLEGSPGVGKTTLIQSMAQNTGRKLVCIYTIDIAMMMDIKVYEVSTLLLSLLMHGYLISEWRCSFLSSLCYDYASRFVLICLSKLI